MGFFAKEKEYTSEQLSRHAKRLRTAMSVASIRKRGITEGKELFIRTDDVQIRVLAYNAQTPGKLPLYVNFHGGGFVMGNAETDDFFMARLAESAGVKILSVDYSLAPEYPFPKALSECYAVIRYAKEHPDEFGIDPCKIAIGGQSAGGNFGAATGLLEGEGRKLGIKGLVLLYPALDIYNDAALKPRPKGSMPLFMCRLFDACYCNDPEERKNPLVSPVYATLGQVAKFPPTLIITAARDSLCAEGERFRDLLQSAGVDVSHKRFDATHGFTHRPGEDADEAWRLIVAHLRRCLHPAPDSESEAPAEDAAPAEADAPVTPAVAETQALQGEPAELAGVSEDRSEQPEAPEARKDPDADDNNASQ